MKEDKKIIKSGTFKWPHWEVKLKPYARIIFKRNPKGMII